MKDVHNVYSSPSGRKILTPDWANWIYDNTLCIREHVQIVLQWYTTVNDLDELPTITAPSGLVVGATELAREA